jgi:myo-inositol 2-dehydrogenase/D-chiro-inositol 1-dehydrogenase
LIQFALLGCGRIGKIHAETIAKAAGAALESAYDPDPQALRSVAERFGCRAAESAEAAMRGADAVLIATPTPTHADLIEAAAKAGKAILCEKPIDLSLERVDACKAAIAGCDVPIQIGFNRRFDPGHRAARKALLAGQIGQLEQVIITSRDPSPPPRSYLGVSGGIFRDMTIHDFDLARYMLSDEPVEVFATGSALVDPTIADEFGDIDSAMIVMRTARGVLCHINNSRRAAYGYDQRVELFGSKGMVISENRRAHELRFFGRSLTEGAEPCLNFFIERYAEAYAAEIEAFIAAVREKRQPEVTFEDGRRALMLAEAAQLSRTTQKTVRVEPNG